MIAGILGTMGQGTIARHIYGHFSEHLGRCIYEGIWVGEDSSIPNTEGYRADVLDALRELRVPVLRWPGGCFADEYHWKDGVGPRENRPTMINTHWGGVTENNHFGTHEFLRLCELIETEPYICGNVGSGTVQEMAEWVEYMTFSGRSPMADWRRENGHDEPWRLKYFGVGNENWGCGGNMTVERYVDEYRRYETYCRDFGDEPLYRIACGPNSGDFRWTDVMMRELARIDRRERPRHMHGLALHFYTNLWNEDGSRKPATGFGAEDYYAALVETLRMEELIRVHGAIMDRYDPNKRVGLIIDEWGTWHRVEEGTNPGFLYQQNTVRDAMVAAINLNLFNRNRDRVKMANIAQLVNVLQSVVLTDGAKMLRTPTYHVFEMFKGHQDAELLDLQIEEKRIDADGRSLPAISSSASRADDGSILVTLANLSHDAEQTVRIFAPDAGDVLEARGLAGKTVDAHNTFDAPDAVSPTPIDGAQRDGEWVVVPVAPASVAAVKLRGGRG